MTSASYFRSFLLAYAIPALAVAATDAPNIAPDISRTTLAYRYGAHFTEPAKPNDIAKNIFTVTHLSQGATGTHFLSAEGRFSDANDPAKDSTKGATEYLVNYRYLLPTRQLLDTPLAFGPVRETTWMAGVDLTEKNTLFAPRKRAWMTGPVFKLDVPGYLDIGVLYYQESNHKGIPHTPHPTTEFEGTWLLNANWAIPVTVGNSPAIFQGLFNRLGAKGNDFNNRPTTGETLLRTALMFDVGRWGQLPPNQLLAGIGYEWWANKYGNVAGVGTETKTVTFNLEYRY